MSTREILLEVAERLPADAALVDAIYELGFRQAGEDELTSLVAANEFVWRKPANGSAMDFKVLLSNEALSDLEGFVPYIAPHSPSAAASWENICSTRLFP